MKAITIRQPWATLLAIGTKRYEFRSWRTMVRGWIVIHAAKGVSDPECDLLTTEEIRALRAYGINDRSELPTGCLVAVKYLAGSEKNDPVADGRFPMAFRWTWDHGKEGELLWRPGDALVEARGQQGFWDWDKARDEWLVKAEQVPTLFG